MPRPGCRPATVISGVWVNLPRARPYHACVSIIEHGHDQASLLESLRQICVQPCNQNEPSHMYATDLKEPILPPLATEGSITLTRCLLYLQPPPPYIKTFEKELKHYPDANFSTRLINSLQHGIDCGYEGPEFANTAANLKSDSEFQPISYKT